jgi:hypothetical protein
METCSLNVAFYALIDERIKSEHFRLAKTVWKRIRQRGKNLSRKSRSALGRKYLK